MNICSYSCCSSLGKELKKIFSLSSILKLISDESRLKLICVPLYGEHCICELMEYVKMSQGLISHHLKDLKDACVVNDEKRGLKVYYFLTSKGKHLVNLLFQIRKEVEV